ncbi:MAG: class 1 fructose-bisphosphatase [Candidatus Levyibacteriota bacterium]
MFQPVTTLTDFILEEEKKYPRATGSLTILLTEIENAAKIIASHVRESGLTDILGKTGKKNSFQEEVQKLDEYSNTLLIETLTKSGQVHAVASEELAEPIYAPQDYAGKYVVFFDPLDGSSNIDNNCPIGTIFSVYEKSETMLQKGEKQIVAGYIMYGSSTIFVYTTGHGVNGFTLDPAVGSFLLSHPDIKIPEKGDIYAINEGYASLFDENVINYLEHVKKDGKYKARFVGAMVADVHRTLLKGGIFIYPKDKKHPDGKLRLMYEVNPMSLLVEQAGGIAISGDINPLTIIPTSVHQTVPIALGSKENVQEYLSFEK